MFAPPLGVPIRLVTERDEGAGAARVVYRTERLVRFTRDGAGYRAEVLVLPSAAAPSANRSEAMFETALAGLAGRRIGMRLDRTGKVLAIDDMDAAWDVFCKAVMALVLARGGHPKADLEALAARIAGPLRAFPIERKQAVFASLVTPLAAEDTGEAPGSVHPVHQPGASPFGGPLTLEGTRTVSLQGTLLRSVTRAAADVKLPPHADAPERSGRVEIEIARTIDPITGLLASGTETLRTTVDGVARPDRVTTVTVTLAPASAWPDG